MPIVRVERGAKECSAEVSERYASSHPQDQGADQREKETVGQNLA